MHELQAHPINLDHHSVSLQELQKEFGTTLFLKKTHPNLNTLIDATQASDSVVLYIDEKEAKLKGASYIVNPGNASFVLQTIEENILILPLPISFKLQEIEFINPINQWNFNRKKVSLRSN